MNEFKRLWGYFWRYRFRFFTALFCSVMVALCAMAFTTLFIPLYQMVLAPAGEPAAAGAGSDLPGKEHILSLVERLPPVEALLRFGREKAFLEVPLFFVLLFFLKGVFSYFSTYLMDSIGLKAIMTLREELYRRIINQAMGFFSAHQTGELISRVTNDVNRLQSTSARQFADLVQFSLILVGQLFLMLYYDWRLSLACGVILPLLIYPVARFGRRMKRVSTRSQQRMAEVSDRLHETIQGARIVTGFNMQEHEASRFSRTLRRLYQVELKGIRVLALSPPVMELVGALAGAVLLWYAGARIRTGTLHPGVLLAFLSALALSFVIIKRLTRINNQLQQALAAARRVFSLIDTAVSVKVAPDAEILTEFTGEIRFRDVTFSYGEKEVLSGISFSVRRGQVVALVGSSGAGKTTLVNLLPRLFDVTGGAIEIDGRDIRGLTLASLRELISMVTQEIILFNDSVRNNIAYGRLGAPDDEVEQAARAAFAHEFIAALPGGYQTIIGERGHFLSVGQRQRLAIARAILRRSPILILDEATSALDSESELLVQNALANLMEGRTVFVIAHRLSTVRRADTILVLDGKRISERGSHEELLAAGGIYTRLHRLQFPGFDA